MGFEIAASLTGANMPWVGWRLLSFDIRTIQVSDDMFAQMRQGFERTRADGIDLADIKPLAALVAAFVMVAGWVWWKWGATGWPVGSFWWDELALSGAAHAMRQGMVPTVDFWTPLVLSLYMKMLTENWVGHQSAYVLECLLQGGMVVAMFAALVGRQRMPASAYWVAGLLALSVMAPFNIGSPTEAQPGTVVNACSYNRLGGGLIALVIMLPVVRRRGRSDFALSLWLGVALAMSALLKITVLQIAWVLIALWALLSGEKGWWRLLMAATVSALLILLPFGPLFNWGQGYASALGAMSELRASMLREHSVQYLEHALDHRLELFVVAFAALLLVWRSTLLGVSWVGAIVWSLMACGALCAYTLTNFGDSGLMPTVAVLWSMPQLLQPTGVATAGLAFADVRRAGLLGKAVGGALLAVGGVYAGAIAYWTWQFEAQHADGSLVAMPSQTTFLKNYHFEESDWNSRPVIYLNGASRNLRRPSMYASYLAGVDEAAVYLMGNFGDKNMSVYALDFPAYVFPMVAGYRVPQNAYAWILYGHEMTIDHHPDPRQLFSDVDVLMLPKCSLAGGNRRLLKALYRVWIENHFEKVASLSCWDVHRKLNKGL